MVRGFGFYFGAVLLASASLPVTSAYAGFEFIAPINQEPVQKAQSGEVPDNTSVEEGDVSPLLPLLPAKESVETEPLSVLPKIMPEKTVSEKSVTPTPPPVIEKEMPPVAVMPAAPTQPKGEVVQGFANQIPLAIALQQVIPARYQYAFADGINPGTKVDWQGGKPWQDVVADMVATKGMSVDISGNIVYIRQQGVASAPMMAPKPVMKKVTEQPKMEPIPLLPIERPTPKAQNTPKDNILFDSPETASLSGVNRPQPTPPSLIVSDRLELGDLSIGQPMQLIPAEQRQPIVQKQASAASAPAPMVPMSSQSAPILPKQRMPVEPVKNKKILLLDEMPETTSVQPKMVAKPEMENIIFDDQAPVSPIQELPDTSSVEMSTAMMDVMKPVTSSSNVEAGGDVWSAESGETLRSVLEKWANRTGTSLIWESEYDYPFQTSVNISGNFEKAVRTVLDGLADANPRPLGRLYKNEPAGQPVLVIETATLTN